MSVHEPVPTFPWSNPRVHRLEWLRFWVAAGMIVVMIAETALLFLVGWYNLAVWLGVIAVMGYALHVVGKMVTRERALAFEEWKLEMDRRMGRVQ